MFTSMWILNRWNQIPTFSFPQLNQSRAVKQSDLKGPRSCVIQRRSALKRRGSLAFKPKKNLPSFSFGNMTWPVRRSVLGVDVKALNSTRSTWRALPQFLQQQELKWPHAAPSLVFSWRHPCVSPYLGWSCVVCVFVGSVALPQPVSIFVVCVWSPLCL